MLKCTTCGAIHNRDHNATKNMLAIIKHLKRSGVRPKRFTQSLPDSVPKGGVSTL